MTEQLAQPWFYRTAANFANDATLLGVWVYFAWFVNNPNSPVYD